MKGGSAYKMQIRLSFYTIMCNRAKERDCLAAAFLCNTNKRLGRGQCAADKG